MTLFFESGDFLFITFNNFFHVRLFRKLFSYIELSLYLASPLVYLLSESSLIFELISQIFILFVDHSPLGFHSLTFISQVLNCISGHYKLLLECGHLQPEIAHNLFLGQNLLFWFASGVEQFLPHGSAESFNCLGVGSLLFRTLVNQFTGEVGYS